MKNIQPNFSKCNGLIPVIIQDMSSKEILMLGFMDQIAYQKTIDTGIVYFWSRSRNTLWLKGQKSGKVLLVQSMYLDCDYDSILIKVIYQGTICHLEKKSCFCHKASFQKT